MEVARIALPGEKGVRPVRQNDAVLAADGSCIGFVLSCAKVGDVQIALVFAKRDSIKEGTEIGAYYAVRGKSDKNEKIELGSKMIGQLKGKGLSRFARF